MYFIGKSLRAQRAGPPAYGYRLRFVRNSIRLQTGILDGKLRDMASVSDFLLGLAGMLRAVFEVFAYPPLFCVAFFAAFVTLVLFDNYRSDAGQIWRLSRWILVGQVGLACLVYVAATIWPAARPEDGPIKENVIGLRAIEVITLFSILVDVWSVWKMRNYRGLAISCSVVHLCFLVALWFLAGMAVTGDAI
jgi:hypothetical protein